MPAVIFEGLNDSTVGDQFRSPVPKFGGACVCCGADAKGVTTNYDIYDVRGRERISGPSVPMPCCEACVPHALAATATTTRMAYVVLTGIVLAVIGVVIAVNSDPAAGAGVGSLGALMIAIGTVYELMRSAKEKSEKQPGHHPRLTFGMFPGQTVLHSENEALIRDLLERNPNARLYQGQG